SSSSTDIVRLSFQPPASHRDKWGQTMFNILPARFTSVAGDSPVSCGALPRAWSGVLLPADRPQAFPGMEVAHSRVGRTQRQSQLPRERRCLPLQLREHALKARRGYALRQKPLGANALYQPVQEQGRGVGVAFEERAREAQIAHQQCMSALRQIAYLFQ